MHRFTISRYCLVPLIAVTALIAVRPAAANGTIGDHVHDLKAHLEEYSDEVDWLLEQADGMIETYAASGSAGVETGELIDNWEAVKVHGAVELNYVPVYANIWQGIYGMKEAMDEGKPVAAVKEQRAVFERALWQGLGVVKLAAQNQAAQPEAARQSGDNQSPTATLDEIVHTLDEVVAIYKQDKMDEAKSLVHSTYINRFEGVEGALIEQDADLVEELEKNFNVTLPTALDNNVPVDNLKKIVENMQGKLTRAKTLLADAERNRKDVF